ncbi:hypothetical protein M1D89_20230 [Arthrobacter sp. D3-18]
MTDLRALLAPIKARLAAATELGAWEVRGKDVVIYDKHGYGAHRIVAWVDHPEYTEPIANAPTDLARLLAAIEAVAGLHAREVIATHEGYGEEAWCPYCCDHWPCETVAALAAALEPNVPLADHYECIAYADDIAEGQDWEVPEDYRRHYCAEDGEDWPCQTVAAALGSDTTHQEGTQ